MIVIDKERCKCCALCVWICPRKILIPDYDGKVRVIDADACVSCKACQTTCPEPGAIRIVADNNAARTATPIADNKSQRVPDTIKKIVVDVDNNDASEDRCLVDAPELLLLQGNESVILGALDAACDAFFAYPITPASEISNLAADLFPKIGACFLQAESEIAAVNMAYGAAAMGKRVMTATSGPGFSLMQEGLSYAACAELPIVIVNVMRAGPGLGNIGPSQSDYRQATKGGGHGDYRIVVLSPSGVPELRDMTRDAFDLAQRFRIPVCILCDEVIAHMRESVALSTENSKIASHAPARDIVNTLRLDTAEFHRFLSQKDRTFNAVGRYVRSFELFFGDKRCDDTNDVDDDMASSELIYVAFGVCARECVGAMKKSSRRIAVFRPILLSPYPYDALRRLSKLCPKADFLCVELNLGQMLDDVRLAVQDDDRVYFYGKSGGMLISAENIPDRVDNLAKP